MTPSLSAVAPTCLRPSAWFAGISRVGFGVALSLLMGTGAAPVQANTVAKAEAECRLTDNGKVVFDGGCSIK